jgi:DnaK suppressor protein
MPPWRLEVNPVCVGISIAHERSVDAISPRAPNCLLEQADRSYWRNEDFSVMRVELEQHRDTLLEMRERLKADVQNLGESIVNNARSVGELSNIPTHPADHDSEGIDVDIALDETESKILQAVGEAIQRMKDGTYGKCEECGAPIPQERLDAIPYTPHCMPCATALESGERVRL